MSSKFVANIIKQRFFILLVILIVFGLVIGSVSVVVASATPVRKIVVFQPYFVNEAAKDELITRTGGIKIKNLDLINARAVYLPSRAAAETLAKQPGILRVDDDVEVFALGKTPLPPPPEQLTWNIQRIKADQVWEISTADPIKVGIIDTGIQLNHPDLAANIKGGYNAINPIKSPNDDNGHGTHVAGIVAAVDNEIGVIGVGPNIDLYAYKVLNRNGSGFLSDVIEGIDKAVTDGMQVINMSLGTNSNIESFHDAIRRANQAGIVIVAAAGNSFGGAVSYPAAYPEVIAVSATDSDDKIASFSSVGPEVDLTSPGVNIYSTYKGSTYRSLSGTSMASPHVAGVAALLLTQTTKCDTDSDGACSPDEVQTRLEATAKDLGDLGKDYQYGSGLVDAYTAITQ